MEEKLKRLVQKGYSYEASTTIIDNEYVYQIEVFRGAKLICAFNEIENLNFDELVIEKIIQYDRDFKLNQLFDL